MRKAIPYIAVFLFVVLAGCGGGGAAAVAVVPIDEAYIFDLTKFHEFEVELDPADWEWLQANATLEEYVPATLIFEGERYEDAALRFKGGFGTLLSCFDDAGTRICPKLGLKVSLVKFGAGRIGGLRKLNFHSSRDDPTFIREVLTYFLFREMGIFAPRATHAKLTVNGEYLGVFVLVEQVDKEFVQEHWTDDEGNLYKEVWPQHDYEDSYIEALRTNEANPDVSRMLGFYEAIQNTTDATFIEDLGTLLDFDYLARYLAVDRASWNRDGTKAFYCYGYQSTYCVNGNYYWYEDPLNGYHLIPWDLAHTFDDVDTDLGRSLHGPDANNCDLIPLCDYWSIDPCSPAEQDIYLLPPQCNRLYGMIHQATWNDYITYLGELANGPLSREAIVPFVEAIREKIQEAVINDPFGPDENWFNDANAWLDTVLERQLAEIQKLIDEETP